MSPSNPSAESSCEAYATLSTSLSPDASGRVESPIAFACAPARVSNRWSAVVPEIPLRVEHPRVAQLRRHRLRLRQSHDGFQPRTLAARVGNDPRTIRLWKNPSSTGCGSGFGDFRHPDALEVLPGPVHQFPGQHVPRHVRENHGRIVSASALRAKLLAKTRRVAQSRRQPHARDHCEITPSAGAEKKSARRRAAPPKTRRTRTWASPRARGRDARRATRRG